MAKTELTAEHRRKISVALKGRYYKYPTISREELEKLHQHMSLKGMGKILNIDKKTARRWLDFHNIPYNPGIGKTRQREASLKHPDLLPSPALAYILGVLLGDGWIRYSSNGKYHYDIGLAVTDRVFAESFKLALEQIRLNPHIYTYKRHSDVHYVTAPSKLFCDWYKELTLKDIEKIIATSTMQQEFIRGFYESEGSAFISDRVDHRYGTNHLTYTIKINNTNKPRLQLIQRQLQDIGFNFCLSFSGVTEAGKSYYALRITRRAKHNEAIKSFFDTINPCIKRLEAM